MWLSRPQRVPGTSAARRVPDEGSPPSSSPPVDVPKPTRCKPVSALEKGASWAAGCERLSPTQAESLDLNSHLWQILLPRRKYCLRLPMLTVTASEVKTFCISSPHLPFQKSQDCIKNRKTDLKYSIMGYLSLWFRDFNKYLRGLELFPTTKMVKNCTLKWACQFFRSLLNSAVWMYLNVYKLR